ncbi:MAG TPA: hypothetical protein K8V15_00420 [Tessaracoccus flavescens]|uniref:Uncharacterized protein n=1 Tax=Tessaracoccus flavescens TaxID=399497 RepID=A0A921JPN4_9ACTN|nr:hypothetical protein [Tessaracoccus flavescens]
MSAATSFKGWLIGGLVSSLAAVVLAVAPTYPFAYAEGPDQVHSSMQSWFAPVLFGGGSWLAPIAGTAAVIAAIAGVLRYLGKSVGGRPVIGAPFVWSAIATLLAVFALALFAGRHSVLGAGVVLATAIASVCWRFANRPALPDHQARP